MSNKKSFIICLIVIILIVVAIFVKIRNDKIAEAKIIEGEQQQVAAVLNKVIINKLAKMKSGYDIEEIQTMMNEEVGNNKVEVYRSAEDVVMIKYIETNHEYKIDDYVNNRFFK